MVEITLNRPQKERPLVEITLSGQQTERPLVEVTLTKPKKFETIG